MPFDPDAYLKKKPEQTTNPFKAEGFDPDAYLKQTPKPFDPDAYLKAKPAEPTQPSAPPEESGFLRQAADIPIGVTKGIATGVRMIADAFGAGSETSKLIKGYEDKIGELLSAQAKNDQKEISRILKDAQDKGVLDQLVAAGKAFVTAPIDLTVQALGTSAPALVTGLATTLGGAPTGVALGTSALMGSVMGAGEAKGGIYEATKEELLNIKVPKDKAEQIAIAAQEYGGKNLDQILLAAGLGAATSVTGFEASAIKGLSARILSKAAAKEAAEKGVARSIATGIAKESIPESLQGAQQQLAENIALQREGFDVPTMRGVVSEGALEALSSMPLGAYGGYRERGAPTVGKDTREGKALSELDKLAAEEEKAARAFVERKLYAELGRPPLEEEILEGINEYFDEQATGRATKPGTTIAGVPSTGAPEAAGVPDTTVPTTPESGRLDTTGGAAEVAGAGEGAKPSALEEEEALSFARTQYAEAIEKQGEYASLEDAFSSYADTIADTLTNQGATPQIINAALSEFQNLTSQPAPKQEESAVKGEPIVTWRGFPVLIAGEPFTDQSGNVQQRVKFPSALGTFEGEGSRYGFVSANELEQYGEYSSDPEIAKLQMRERSAFGDAKSLENQQKELLTKAGRKPAKNSPARQKYDELEKRRVQAYWDWVESEDRLSKAQKKAAPKTEESTGEKRDVATYLEGYPQETKRYNTYINNPEIGPLLQSANAAIQKLTDFINSRGFLVREVNRATPDQEVQRAKDLSSEVSGIAARLLLKQDAVDRGLKRANSEQLASAKAELQDFLRSSVDTFLPSPTVEEQRQADEEPNLSSKGWTTAETEISEDEKKVIEQFRRAGDLQPDVVRAILNNDLNGALNILAKRLGGFYGELATKLASLNLQTSIAFNNGADVANRAILATVGPQLQRITSYIRIADPDLYKRRFEGFENPENMVSASIGITVLQTQNKHPAIAIEIEDAYQAYKKYMVVATAPGAYLNMFDTITLNTKQIEGIGNRVFLHEVVHAATVSILRADPSQLTKEQLAAREEIEKLYKLAQRNLKVGEYGLTNKFEFLAELFTNDDFRKLLKAIPYPPASTNILSRFFNAILRLVGADNLASRAMVEAEKLFTSARYQATKPMGPLFAQAPKKRRVRGPISTPDTYRTAETQQNTFNQTLKDAYDGRMSWADAAKIIGPTIWDSSNTLLRKATLPVLNLTQLEDLTRTKFTQITGALKIIRDMVASRAKKMNIASEIMRDWTKAQKKNFAQSQLMGRIMMEATIRGIDPDTAPAGALNKPLQDAWNTLDNDFKIIYRRVRDFYANSVNEMVREMKRRALANPDPEKRKSALRKIDEQFGPDKLIKPYFPLRRFGQYFYQVGEKNFKEFYEFEDPFTRDAAMRKRIKDLSAGNEQQRKLAASVQKGNGISELYGKNISTTQALKDVEELVDNISATDVADLKNQLKDSLNQLIYILLPQQSVRKMFINRKSIQGASADMLRVFATTAVHSAYQQSRFMYSEKFLQNLNNARDEIINAQKMGMLSIDDAAMYKDFILEVEQRVPTIMSNEDTSMTAQVAGKASELTFYYMLSAPFTAMLNTIGAVQLAMPYIGGSYGYVRANALLTKNMGRYLATSPTRTFSPLTKRDFAQVNFPSIAEGRKLPPLLQKAADRFIDDGVIDISLTNDIFELGERPSALYTGTAATVKKVMSGLFHQSERMNREIVLLTTFELAYEKFLNDYQRQPGMEGLRGVYLRDARGDKIKNTPDQAFELAIEEATRVTSTSLGDYSRQTKGRIFANPIMNLLLKFKQYPILAMYSIMRNFHVGIVAPFKKAEIDQYRALLEQELKNDPNKDKVIAQRLQEVEAQRKALEKEGRRRLAGILGMTTILGGVAASPFFSLVVGSLVKMFADDDDDEYFDWENWFYNYMETEFGGYAGAMLANAGVEPKTAEKAGRKVGEAVSRGLPAAMGAAVADRVSLDPKALLWRDGRYSPDARENFIESLIANAGPVVGLGLNFVDAYQLAKEGQYARAMEKAVPAIIAKPASAMRMEKEGATTKKGDVLIDDFTATELAMQSIGLQPERLAQKQKAAIAIKQKEQKILDAREAIMDRLWMERDNPDGYEAAMERAIEFNSKRKDPKMHITPKKISESFKKRAQLKAEAEALGAKYDKRLRSELMGMGEFADDE